MRISDWSSDVCSSDLRKFCTVDGRSAVEGDILVSVRAPVGRLNLADTTLVIGRGIAAIRSRSGHQNLLFEKLKEVFAEEDSMGGGTIFKAIGKSELQSINVLRVPDLLADRADSRSEEHTSELQSLMRISYAVFCLQKKN